MNLHNVTSKAYLYEGLGTASTRSMMLWESAGFAIKEAELTKDQIDQLFTSVEQVSTDGGSNRTMIGKGKDAASAVNKAWEDLKTKVQNSGPIKSVDAAYDSAAEKLKKATGGDDGVMKYVQKYRDFAKKYPVSQSLIYAALIAAAGISGAGLGGAAALGLFKMVDKLLQGEKFSSSAYAGAKTGATAYAAGQIGQALKGGDQASHATSASTDHASGITGDMSYDQAYNTYIQKFAQDPQHPSAMVIQQAKQFAATKAKVSESVNLSTNQINEVFHYAANAIILEGVWDSIKGAVSNKASQIGKDMTTKVTANKLAKAWAKAGSPTDSNKIAKLLYNNGIPIEVIKQSFNSSKIPLPFKSKDDKSADPKNPTAAAGATDSPKDSTAPADAADTDNATPAASAGSNAFSQMTAQLGNTSTTSTGGEVTKTPTGIKHTSAANLPIKKLEKDWIEYLKRSQIVQLKSDPETGKLAYKRPVKLDDVTHFLQSQGYEDEQIETALSFVKLTGQPAPTTAPAAAPAPATAATPAAAKKADYNQGGYSSVKMNAPTGVANPLDNSRPNASATTTPPATKGKGGRKPGAAPSQTPDAIRKRAARQKKKAGVTEDFTDKSVEVSEKDVEKIFAELLKSKPVSENTKQLNRILQLAGIYKPVNNSF
jgi:hypothetical protein